MLCDLCSIFGLFSSSPEFSKECATSGYYTPDLLGSALTISSKLNLFTADKKRLFALLVANVEDAKNAGAQDENLVKDAPEEFLDPLMFTLMRNPFYLLTSKMMVDHKTIKQHLLNESFNPFKRAPLIIDMIEPATALKEKIDSWISQKRLEAV